MATTNATATVINAFTVGQPVYNGSNSSAILVLVLSGASVTEQVQHLEGWAEADLRQQLEGIASMSEDDFRKELPRPVSPYFLAFPHL